MSQLINENKLAQLTGFLEKLQEFEKISYEEFEQDKHFAVERLLELLVIYASDILLNYFSQIKEDIPTTLRTTFLRAGELKVLPDDLTQRLSKAAGMRNVLVRAYSEVDLKIVYDSIGLALKDFSQFVEIVSEKMNLIQQDPPEQPPEEA
jgi:uncharacterized protein YutE (UPF0331/DUF86 family)